MIILALAFDTKLEGEARMVASFEAKAILDICPNTVLVVVARVLVLLVVAGVVAAAECEHKMACSKNKARQARAPRHAKQVAPEAKLVKSPTAESECTGLTKKSLRRRAGSKPGKLLTVATKDRDSGKALSATDCDASSSDSESSNAGESGCSYEQGARTPRCRRSREQPYVGARGESAAAAEAASSRGVDGAQVHRLTEDGGDRRAASIEDCTELAAGRAPDAAQPPRPAARMELPDAFLCPLTLEPMQHPVVTCDGQTYERDAIEQWLRRSSTSPLTGQQLQHLGLAPNVVLRGLIRDALEGLYHESRGKGSGSSLRPGLSAHGEQTLFFF